MQAKHYILAINILVFSVLPNITQAGDQQSAQVNLLAKYFANALDTTPDRIEIELIHTPNIDAELIRNKRIEIQRGRGKFTLGHQTLWMVHKVENSVRKRYPVTIDVYANIEVPTAIRKIERLETLTENSIQPRMRRVGREYLRIQTNMNQLYGQMSTQLIREGRVIETNMYRQRPDVLLGDALQIIINNEGLYLELPGIAKEEGLIGEAIRVQCPSTRKEFSGILNTQNQVSVSLR